MAAKFYQVGGSVRDELLGFKSKDIDYAVETDSFDTMREAILDRGGEIFLESPTYFTIRAKVPVLGACDFVLCRKDGVYSDGRRPETVSVGTIFDDLARRDFTVNAIAKTEDGTLLDPHDGVRDLKIGIIRCVGAAEDRFTEDGLRMIRALRFAITKDFMIDAQVHQCLSTPSFFQPRLRGVSIERIREELSRMFVYKTPMTLWYLHEYQLLTEFLFSTSQELWLKPTLEAR